MNVNIKPYPITQGSDAYVNQLGAQVNNNRLVAGKGIDIRQLNNGTQISLKPTYLNNKMRWAGDFNPYAEYFIGDVVNVSGDNIYYSGSNQSQSVANIIPFSYDLPSSFSGSWDVPYLAAGLYCCTKYIPPSFQDSYFLTSTIIPTMTANGGSMNDDFGSYYRYNAYNVYFPVYPLIPTASQVVVPVSSGGQNWHVTANDTFWAPLVPYIVSQVCINGVAANVLMAAYANFTFEGNLPY